MARKSSAAFASLVVLPDVITGPGQYRTRCGETVTVCTLGWGASHAYSCVGCYDEDGTSDKWHRSGRLYFGIECRNDIVSRVEA